VNFATIKHIATNLLRKAPGKGLMLTRWPDSRTLVKKRALDAAVLMRTGTCVSPSWLGGLSEAGYFEPD
jgi:hypothetical protein